jgi:hypothetical protein
MKSPTSGKRSGSKTLLACVLLAALAVGFWSVVRSGAPARYPQAAEVAFSASCERAGGSATQCGCALRRAEAVVPYKHHYQAGYTAHGLFDSYIDTDAPQPSLFAPCLARTQLAGDYTPGIAEPGSPIWYTRWTDEGFAPNVAGGDFGFVP